MSRFDAKLWSLYSGNFQCSHDEIFVKMTAFLFHCNSVALYTNIDVMGTGVFSPGEVLTVCQVGFMALAIHIIQPDGASAWPVLFGHHPQPEGVTQHLADDISFLLGKIMCTHGAPLPIVVYFNSSAVRVRSTIRKTDWKASTRNGAFYVNENEDVE